MGSPLFFSKILTSSPSISSCFPLQRSPPSSRQTESSWLITVMRLRWCMLWVWPCTTGVANARGYFCFLDTCVHVYTKWACCATCSQSSSSTFLPLPLPLLLPCPLPLFSSPVPLPLPLFLPLPIPLPPPLSLPLPLTLLFF
jgi:hypothetical protein